MFYKLMFSLFEAKAFTMHCYILIVFLFILLSLVGLKYWNYITRYSKFPSYSLTQHFIRLFVFRKAPKHLPLTCVLFQNLVSIMKKFQDEGICLMWFGQPYLYLFNEEASKIFTNEPDAVDKPETAAALKDVFGTGLLTSEGKDWRWQRKMLNPVFHIGELKQKIPIFNEQAQILVRKLQKIENKSSVDIYEYLHDCALHALFESVLGLNVHNEEDEEALKKFVEYTEVGSDIMMYRICFNRLLQKFMLPLLPLGRKFLKMQKEQDKFIEKVVLNMRESIRTDKPNREISEHKEGSGKKSFTRILLDLHIKNPAFTIDHIKNQVFTFMAAGYDTVSHSLLWCLFMLGNHPKEQERAINEVDNLSETVITYEDLHKLQYLECIIKESMRLITPFLAIMRHAKKDIQCGKYLVPKGTTVLLCPYMMHRDPKIYPNPEKFDPDRFRDNNMDKRSWTYTPFAEGLRSCIGKKYAMMEMMVVLAHILRNFRVKSLVRLEDLNLCLKIILKPADPVIMELSPRI